jgi:hypothetical protein
VQIVIQRFSCRGQKRPAKPEVTPISGFSLRAKDLCASGDVISTHVCIHLIICKCMLHPCANCQPEFLPPGTCTSQEAIIRSTSCANWGRGQKARWVRSLFAFSGQAPTAIADRIFPRTDGSERGRWKGGGSGCSLNLLACSSPAKPRSP